MTIRIRRLLPLGLLFALVTSLGANLVLFRQGQIYYKDLQTTRLDPLGLGLLTPMPPLENQQPVVVFYGDSRAADWPAPEGLAEFAFVNRGLDGQTSAQVLGRYDEHIEPLNAKIVVVQVGVNDLKTIPLFPDQETAIIAACQRHIEQLVEQALADGSSVVLTTIFPVGPVPLTRRLVWSPAIAEAVLEVNDFLRGLASDRVTVLDAYALLAEGQQTKPAFVRDTLHLNEAGYAALNEALASLLAGQR
jgi:lysophospholipase L1-like esterase